MNLRMRTGSFPSKGSTQSNRTSKPTKSAANSTRNLLLTGNWSRVFAVIVVVLGALSCATDACAQTAYAGVWRPGTGAQWWRTGMTADELKAQDKTYFDQGLRLEDVDIKNGKYAAVWRPGSGAQWWRAGMTADELKAQDKTYFDQGLRLTA